jgi:hypothetical protein
MSVVENIRDACRDKRDALELRRQQIAAIARELAHELSAKPGPDPGEWQLKCPHCHRITTISEEKGAAFIPGGMIPARLQRVSLGVCANALEIFEYRRNSNCSMSKYRPNAVS